MIDNTLYSYMREMLGRVPENFVRYMYPLIRWDVRMVGITGPRGVGKSTMVLQHIKKSPDAGHHLYVSADHIYFSNHTIVQLADDFVKEGGTHLYIDEAHKYNGWSRELKQIYDVHPDLHIVFTGSSVLDIRKGEADLSRRALMFHMQGLSFREFLEMHYGLKSRTYTLQEILSNAVTMPGEGHPLPLFRQYLESGYYPFSAEGDFTLRMEQVVSQTVETDIPLYADMRASTARKLKRLLSIISTLAPYKPNIESLSVEVGASKNSIPDYLTYLERAGMIRQLRNDTGGLRELGKVEKVYIDNPSLMTVLAGGNPNVGNMRETFFYNQMSVNNAVTTSTISDFVIDGNTFEVGGHNKTRKQIRLAESGYVVKDDIEYGHGLIIPLWHFGFNY